MLETACRQARIWRDARPNAAELFMSVNLSARQFVQPDLVDQVAAILEETGLDPTGLELEITESVLMDQSEVGIRTLSRLRELGVRLVLDDFGTGYSSLSYLKHLPLDTIKIDRSFVAGLAGDTDRSIIEAVVALARGLHMGVVAEGIETEAQFDILRKMGCDVGQGYLFCGPLPANEAVRLLSARRSRSATRDLKRLNRLGAPAALRPRVKVRSRAPGRAPGRPVTLKPSALKPISLLPEPGR